MSKELPWVFENAKIAVIYMPGARPPLEVPHSFSFVLNVSELVDQGPDAAVALAPGHELRRATESEIGAIKDVLTNQAAETNWESWQNGGPVENGESISRPLIPEDKWRYFVIAFEGSNSTVAEIERALCIAPFELKIGFTLLQEVFPGNIRPMLIYHPARLFSLVRSLREEEPFSETALPFLAVTRADIETVVLLHHQILASGENVENLKRFIAQMLDLDALPHKSPLLFLGYFAILESLITHQPRPTDTIDSITRQVKQKVVLLNNRWKPRIDYAPFGESKPDTIWKAMYSYRSCLAHGGEPDFKGDLQLLGNPDRALKLLKETVRCVLRQSLIEPQLILDLRSC
jgi:hypothetical protein